MLSSTNPSFLTHTGTDFFSIPGEDEDVTAAILLDRKWRSWWKETSHGMRLAFATDEDAASAG